MIILRSLCIFLLVVLVYSSPPEDPIKCTSKNSNCVITNSYGVFPDRSICQAAEVIYPTTEKELVAAIAKASQENRKVKLATRYSHSITKLVCPDGKDGLLISTRYLNKTIEVNAASRIITVESGVTLREVIDQAAKAGLALPYTPYWWGLTIGGLLGTGAHGSTLWGNGSAVHDYVIGLRIVTPAGADEGYAKVISLDNSHSDMDAAKVSLGVLGAISQFADITWYPSQKKVVYKIDNRVSVNASGNEEDLESRGFADGKCIGSRLTTATLMATGYGYSSNGLIFTGYPIVGFHNRLQASGSCLDSRADGQTTVCPWDSRVNAEYFHQTTFSIALSNVNNFIKDVQKLRDLEPNAFCGVELYNGILLRYVKASSAYMGKEEDAVDFDVTYYRSKDPLVPRLHGDILEEVEQLAMFKYGGIPHWGKNRNVAFDGVIKKYKRAKEFLEVKNKYDPNGLLSNEWTDQILGIKGNVQIVRDGCGLEGLCTCSEDSHCAPNRGYVCRAGRVYKDARVCTRSSSSTVTTDRKL
ncbi:hypothetical protein ACHQM5_013796 [Ranunculus cassubicifolius]